MTVVGLRDQRHICVNRPGGRAGVPGLGEEAEAAGGESADPAGVALALTGASREEADGYLRDQRHHLHEQLKQLRLDIWEKRFGLMLRAATVAVGVGIVCFLVAAVWNAAHSDGLVIESFSVPPDMAARGLNGQVIATQLLDRFSYLQAQSSGIRTQSSFANDWSDDLKVEIPETGVSLGEFNRYLRRWLGHETHISGEVVRLDGGTIEVTARANSNAGQSFSGSEGDFHALLAKAADAIYADTQPISYLSVLGRQGRLAEEEAFAWAHTMTGPASERAWAYTSLARALLSRNQTTQSIRAGRAAVALNPGFAFGWYDLALALRAGGFSQASLDAAKKSLSLQPASSDLSPVAMLQGLAAAKAVVAEALGDFDQQIAQSVALYPMIDFSADPVTQTHQAETATGGNVRTPIAFQRDLARARIGQHDLRAARQVLADERGYIAALKTEPIAARLGQAYLDRSMEPYRNVALALAIETGSWALVRQMVPAMEAEAAKGAAADLGSAFNLQAVLWPDLALAEAQTGDFAAAHAEIDKTPSDCDLCLRTRAKIDALQKNPAGADFWFARAEALAPSIPFADQDWGRTLLQRGDAEKAMEKFKASSAKSPHFADPLEGWGEALMAKNQSHLAVIKFEAADKYAPNWGRLHLKWGEALYYSGHGSEAKTQFARAAQLNLTQSEKTELARHP